MTIIMAFQEILVSQKLGKGMIMLTLVNISQSSPALSIHALSDLHTSVCQSQFYCGLFAWIICAILITSSAFIQHFDGFKVEVYLPPLTTEVRDFQTIRSSRLVMFSGKGVLKICSKFIGEQP